MNENPIDFLSETLALAGQELMTRFGQDNNVRSKHDNSLVSDADLASEKIILDRLIKFFPKDAIISEESRNVLITRTKGQYVWIIDPLDGTTNFAHRYPFFCISIGYGQILSNGKIQMLSGGILDPIRGNMYLASLGNGSTCNGKKISVGSKQRIEDGFLVTGFYYTIGSDLDREMNRFKKVAQKCQSIRRDGSAALDLALVASGIYDGFWERGLAIWDIAAGSLLISEAGGFVSNYPASDHEQANSTSYLRCNEALNFSLDGDGIIGGSEIVVNELSALLANREECEQGISTN